MAQWENKEETELKVPGGTLPLCVNNCGLPANPTTNNMCQACFKASLSTLRPSDPIRIPRSDPIRQPEAPERPDPAAEAPLEASPAARVVNRCAGCRKKVGLTGFRCRCGELFCVTHRYSDRHRCGFDYKAAGREAIARENPVCKAAKIVRF